MQNLKLRAEDIEDITIISAYLQDAITMMSDIIFQKDSHRFVMMLNRYVWENRCPDTGKVLSDSEMPCSRIRTGLHVEDVIKISSQNINTTLKDHPLELLAIEATQEEGEMAFVDFIFSGNGIIRLNCETISVHIQDIGAPWPAKCHPKHNILGALQENN